MLVARRARLGDPLLARTVRRLHVPVALVAGSGCGRGALVHTMAADAETASVHRDRGECPLRLFVTALAVDGRKVERATPIDGHVPRPVEGERVTAPAVRRRILAEDAGRLRARVLDPCFLFVADRALRGRDGAHGLVTERVAARAGDALVLDVDPVPAHVAQGGPVGRHVHAAARPVRRGRGVRAGKNGRETQGRNQKGRRQWARGVVQGARIILMGELWTMLRSCFSGAKIASADAHRTC
jgi:hypothetical protein